MKGLFVVAAIATLFIGCVSDSTKLLSLFVWSKRARERGIRDTPRIYVDSKSIADLIRQVA